MRTVGGMDDLRGHVTRYLELSGDSARGVAARATIKAGTSMSNTTVSNFLSTGKVTPAVRKAFALGMGWPSDWPENPPPLPVSAEHEDKLDQILSKLDGLATGAEVRELRDAVLSMGASVSRLLGVDPDEVPQEEQPTPHTERPAKARRR